MSEVTTTRKLVSYIVTIMLLYFCKYSYDAHQKSAWLVLPPVTVPTQTEPPFISPFSVNTLYSADAEVHVIGIFEGECTNLDAKACAKEYEQNQPPKRDVMVNITASAHPIILTLMSHGPVQWHLSVAKETKIEQIILGGFYAQEVMGIDNSIPVAVYTYHSSPCINCVHGQGFFESYTPKDDVMEKLFVITGRNASTFQGSYSGRSFHITDNTPKFEMPNAALK